MAMYSGHTHCPPGLRPLLPHPYSANKGSSGLPPRKTKVCQAQPVTPLPPPAWPWLSYLNENQEVKAKPTSSRNCGRMGSLSTWLSRPLARYSTNRPPPPHASVWFLHAQQRKELARTAQCVRLLKHRVLLGGHRPSEYACMRFKAPMQRPGPGASANKYIGYVEASALALRVKSAH